MENIAGLKFSVVSGLLAAFSGFFGKITFDSQIVDTISSKLHVGPFVCQVLFGLALVLSNILMLQNFNKALQASKTTLEASIINTASNFVFTALIGYLAFNEELSVFWWSGTSLIIIGTYLVSTEGQEKGKEEKLE